MMHFVCTFSIMRACGVRLIAIKEVRIMGKLYTSKTLSKIAGGRMHTPYPIPLDPPLAISYKNHQQNLAYFSHLRGHGTMPLSLKCAQSSRRRGAKRLSTGGPNLKLSKKAAVFKRVSFSNWGGEHVDWGGMTPLWCRP